MLGLVGLIVGIPIGVLTGDLIWRLVAESLGVAVVSTIPLLGILLVIPCTLALVNLIGFLPARTAARTRPGVAASIRISRRSPLNLGTRFLSCGNRPSHRRMLRRSPTFRTLNGTKAIDQSGLNPQAVGIRDVRVVRSWGAWSAVLVARPRPQCHRGSWPLLGR